MNALGIFDSGLGGLTVAKEILHELPNESLLYFGDTARLPYGNKSPETVKRYSLEIAHFLKEKGVKALVIACNTASAFSVDLLQSELSLPTIGVIEPGARAALQCSKTERIAVLATKSTVKSGAYTKTLQSLSPHVEVTEVACPLLVPLIEERYADTIPGRAILDEYLNQVDFSKVDTLLLGCTHYPLVQTLIRATLPPHVQIVNSAAALAKELRLLLQMNELLSPEAGTEHQFYTSDDVETFQKEGSFYLGRELAEVKEGLTNFSYH